MAENDELKIEKQKEIRKRIKKKTTDLLSFYSSAPVDLIKAYRSTIESLAKIVIHIQDCEEDILINGRRIMYKNGKNQWGWKRNDDIDTLKELTLLKIKIEDHLQKVLYGDSEKEFDDGFDDHIKR